MQRMTLAAVGMIFMHAPMATELVEFKAPGSLDGPIVSQSALGTTYRWRARQPDSAAHLEISVVTLPDEVANTRIASPTMCVAMFAGELRKQSTDFYIAPEAEPLDAAGRSLTQMRWTRDDGTVFSTGVTACAVDGRRFIAVNFGAAPAYAVNFMADLRQHLPALKVSP